MSGTEAAEFQHLDWSTIPSERIDGGIERQMICGSQLMVCRIRIPPGIVTAVHAHPHEQITLVERGTLRFIVGGQERLSSKGDVLHFPSHCAHGAATLDEEVVLLDIFSPPREDFLAVGGDAGVRPG
ncbi:MAG TPA: cupin domain-containing protein [Vicinamibacterales bacterium]|nr:cupin domain-containing protein [Vicinamibacterales bacterium]